MPSIFGVDYNDIQNVLTGGSSMSSFQVDPGSFRLEGEPGGAEYYIYTANNGAQTISGSLDSITGIVAIPSS
jgi:hypothetical protein